MSSGDEPKVVMVTGGSGLVGSGIRRIIETEEARPDERWVFVDSDDADLTLVSFFNVTQFSQLV